VRAAGLGQLGPAFVAILWAYDGYSASTMLAGEVRTPQRTLPVGLLLGLAFIAAAYVGTNIVYFHVLGFDGVASSEAVAAQTLAAAIGPRAAQVIALLVDGGDFLEVQRDFAKNLVVGFGRIQGLVAGIVANQPTVKAGTLDIDSSDKGARFIRFCNIFNIPIVTLVDIPGFMPGVAQERGGIIRHGAKMLFAYAAATVPKITVIMRKAYGGAYLAMCSRDMGADFVYAWPCSEIAVMGAEGAVGVLYKKEIAAAVDPKHKAAELAAEYREKFSSPYEAAAKALINDIIEPAQTRGIVAMTLRNTLSKRETRPPKKHGNIPL